MIKSLILLLIVLLTALVNAQNNFQFLITASCETPGTCTFEQGTWGGGAAPSFTSGLDTITIDASLYNKGIYVSSGNTPVSIAGLVLNGTKLVFQFDVVGDNPNIPSIQVVNGANFDINSTSLTTSNLNVQGTSIVAFVGAFPQVFTGSVNVDMSSTLTTTLQTTFNFTTSPNIAGNFNGQGPATIDVEAGATFTVSNAFSLPNTTLNVGEGATIVFNGNKLTVNSISQGITVQVNQGNSILTVLNGDLIISNLNVLGSFIVSPAANSNVTITTLTVPAQNSFVISSVSTIASFFVGTSQVEGAISLDGINNVNITGGAISTLTVTKSGSITTSNVNFSTLFSATTAQLLNINNCQLPTPAVFQTTNIARINLYSSTFSGPVTVTNTNTLLLLNTLTATSSVNLVDVTTINLSQSGIFNSNISTTTIETTIILLNGTLGSFTQLNPNNTIFIMISGGTTNSFAGGSYPNLQIVSYTGGIIPAKFTLTNNLAILNGSIDVSDLSFVIASNLTVNASSSSISGPLGTLYLDNCIFNSPLLVTNQATLSLFRNNTIIDLTISDQSTFTASGGIQTVATTFSVFNSSFVLLNRNIGNTVSTTYFVVKNGFKTINSSLQFTYPVAADPNVMVTAGDIYVTDSDILVTLGNINQAGNYSLFFGELGLPLNITNTTTGLQGTVINSNLQYQFKLFVPDVYGISFYADGTTTGGATTGGATGGATTGGATTGGATTGGATTGGTTTGGNSGEPKKGGIKGWEIAIIVVFAIFSVAIIAVVFYKVRQHRLRHHGGHGEYSSLLNH